MGAESRVIFPLMRTTRTSLTSLMFALALASLPATTFAQAEKPGKKNDVTGTWLFSVTTDLGTGTPTVTLKQRGDTLTGHYSSQNLGEAEVTGTVRDQTITFTIKVEVQGTPITVTYSGKLESADAMKGTVDFAGMGSGTFTAKRQ
jgi:hypothetical protein